jgi:hypothetical protein
MSGLNEWLRITNFQEFTTCLTASVLLRGGCGLGLKSGWTAESQAWHCCRVSCRLTCFWSSCSKLRYTWSRKVTPRLWELPSLPLSGSTGIKGRLSSSTLKWIFPSGLATIHVAKVVAYVPNCCQMQWQSPVYNFSIHPRITLYNWLGEREHERCLYKCQNALECMKSVKEVVIDINQKFL